MAEDRPAVNVFHLRDTFPVLWERNKIAATDRSWWFYPVTEASRWFTALCIGVLEPGQSEGFHSHLEEYEGPYECWYLVLRGRGQLRTEFGDHDLEEFDAAFMPTGASHQMRNPGTETLWYASLSSRGGQELKVDTYGISCSEERPGYAEEFERIMAAREDRGLSTF